MAKKFAPILPRKAVAPDSWPTPGLQKTITESRAFYTEKRILVTGAFGFVGGHLSRALHAAGAFVTALDKDTSPERESQLNCIGLRDELEVVEIDITDRQAMHDLITQGDFDLIFHIAAGATVIEKALHDPYATIMANTMGFVNIAEAARQLPEGERPVIIYSSTDKVYGESNELPYVEEKSNYGAIGVYDSAKLAADIFASTYDKALGVPTIVLRMCNLFGPYDYSIDYRLIPKAMRNIFRDGEALELYFNALEHMRDYLYVEDAVRAFMHLGRCQGCRGRSYNLPGAHYAATPDVLRDVIETIEWIQMEAREIAPHLELAKLHWNRSIRIIESDPKLIVISKQHLDGSRIGREADFEPSTSFRDGLRRTALFYYWQFSQQSAQLTAELCDFARRFSRVPGVIHVAPIPDPAEERREEGKPALKLISNDRPAVFEEYEPQRAAG